jgi:subfamily B ATP-binding cassette protein MsbA
MLAINQPIKKFQESYVRIQETIVAATRVYAVLDEKNEVPAATHPHLFPHDWKKIVYKDVSFSYGQDMILKNISLEIKRGEKIAFVGESGSGKSTIVNLLERFYDPTSGQILIDDIPIQNLDLKSLRAHIALVTQDVFLFNDSIERNIQAGDFSKTSQKFKMLPNLPMPMTLLDASRMAINPMWVNVAAFSRGAKNKESALPGLFLKMHLCLF